MARRRRKRRIRGALLILAIALIVAGLLAKRLMAPRMMHYINSRALPQHGSGSASPESASNDAGNPSGEHITESDRRKLDEVIKRKTDGGR